MDTGFACTIQRAFLAVVLGILPTSASAAKLSMRNVIHSLEERLTEAMQIATGLSWLQLRSWFQWKLYSLQNTALNCQGN